MFQSPDRHGQSTAFRRERPRIQTRSSATRQWRICTEVTSKDLIQHDRLVLPIFSIGSAALNRQADSKLFREIESMESFGDFGNKIQTLVRHLLYLQQSDPGAKSIVFSAWADSLHSKPEHRSRRTNGLTVR